MDCPKCRSSQSKKNGFRRGKQSYRCKNCGTQYVAHPCSRAYSPQIKQTCIEMYLNGMGIRGISRVSKISHPTILNWIQEAGESLSDEAQDEEIPEITEIDELQTFVGNKRNKYWVWTVVNHKKKGIILWTRIYQRPEKIRRWSLGNFLCKVTTCSFKLFQSRFTFLKVEKEVIALRIYQRLITLALNKNLSRLMI